MDMTRDTHLVFPVHPRTRSKLTQIGLMDALDHPWVCLIEPLGYLAFVDHAGIGVRLDGLRGSDLETTACLPILTIRENTERPIVHGRDQSSRRDRSICDERAFSELSLNSKDDPPRPEFWDGGTADRIARSSSASLDGM